MKVDKNETKRRVKYIYQLLTRRHLEVDIVENCSKRFNVSKSYVYRLIKKAHYLSRNTNTDIEKMLRESNDFYDELIRQCLRVKDYKTAAYCNARKDKINGLEVEKVEHTGELKVVYIPEDLKDK
jgi:hypothetical protein